MTRTIVLAANGPGELAGWVRPVATALRHLAPPTFLTLAVVPSQFASGREPSVARQWGLFDHIVGPRESLGFALGLGRLPVAPPATVVHLGGDLLVSSRLARRWRGPAAALVERADLIARRHKGFARVLVVSHHVAQAVAARGVSPTKIVVTGDPRFDVVGAPPGVRRDPDPSVISILAGSRDQLFALTAPYFLGAAAALHRLRPVTVQVAVSPFLSPEVVARVCALAAVQWPDLQVRWLTGDEVWPRLRDSRLVLTIPGTNTLELALAHIPFAVVVPLEVLHRAPLEGGLEWLGRIPGIDRIVKGIILKRHLSHAGFVALPNLRAGTAIVPEWIGRWSPDELAGKIADLAADDRRLQAIAAALGMHFPPAAGAAAAVAREIVALADGAAQGI